ncbi:hypothetical protein CVT26_013233, partial [Gymnopilus dilepis]
VLDARPPRLPLPKREDRRRVELYAYGNTLPPVHGRDSSRLTPRHAAHARVELRAIACTPHRVHHEALRAVGTARVAHARVELYAADDVFVGVGGRKEGRKVSWKTPDPCAMFVQSTCFQRILRNSKGFTPFFVLYVSCLRVLNQIYRPYRRQITLLRGRLSIRSSFFVLPMSQDAAGIRSLPPMETSIDWSPELGPVTCLSAEPIPAAHRLLRDEKLYNTGEYHKVRRLNDSNIWLAFFPVHLAFKGYLFACLDYCARDFNNLIEHVGFGRFALKQSICNAWWGLESTLFHVTRILVKHHKWVSSLPDILPPSSPTEFGYSRTHKSRADALNAALKSQAAFLLLIGYTSFVLSLWLLDADDMYLDEAMRTLSSYGNSIPHVWLDLFQKTIVCDFSPGLRVGGILDGRGTGWARFFYAFHSAGVPMWLEWGDNWETYTIDNPLLLPYFPDPQSVDNARRMFAASMVTANDFAAGDYEVELEDDDEDYLDDPKGVYIPPELAKSASQLEIRALIVHPNSAQRPQETWEQFKARKESARQRSIEAESLPQKTSREALELNARLSGPNGKATFFIWVRDKYLKTFFRRKYVTRVVGMRAYKKLSKSQMFYWAIGNQWDLVPHLPASTAKEDLDHQVDSDDDDDDNDDDDEEVIQADGPSMAELRAAPDAQAAPMDERVDAQEPDNIGDIMLEAVRGIVAQAEPVAQTYTFSPPSLAQFLRQRYGFLVDLDDNWHPDKHVGERKNLMPPEKHLEASKALLFSKSAMPTTARELKSVVDFHNIALRPDLGFRDLPANFDLSPLHPDILRCDMRRIRLQRVASSLPDSEANTLYVLRPPSNSSDDSPWYIATTSPTTVLLVYRSTWTTMQEIARGLLSLGVRFRTVVEVEQKNSVVAINASSGRSVGLGTRTVGFQASKDDYDAYVVARNEVLRSDQGRAIRLYGGLVGRIAAEVVSDDKVLEGPSLANAEVVGTCGNWNYVDDKAEDINIDIVSGVYRVPMSNSKNASLSYPSWYPSKSYWQLGGLFFEQWTPDAEDFYMHVKGKYSNGVYQLTGSRDWKKDLKRHKARVRPIWTQTDKWASAFIAEGGRLR